MKERDKIPKFHDLYCNVLDLPLIVKGNKIKKEGILKMCQAT